VCALCTVHCELLWALYTFVQCVHACAVCARLYNGIKVSAARVCALCTVHCELLRALYTFV